MYSSIALGFSDIFDQKAHRNEPCLEIKIYPPVLESNFVLVLELETNRCELMSLIMLTVLLIQYGTSGAFDSGQTFRLLRLIWNATMSLSSFKFYSFYSLSSPIKTSTKS